MNESHEGSKLIFEELEPEESTTGNIVFRVVAKRTRRLDIDGNLIVFQFSDVENVQFGGPAEQRIGIIRTYR
jgi:hypothetical protein